MRTFEDETGRAWIATAEEEDTPRHHGRWYLVFRPADAEKPRLAMPEVRWKNLQTAERTIATMGTVELRRRLRTLMRRTGIPEATVLAPAPDRGRDANAG